MGAERGRELAFLGHGGDPCSCIPVREVADRGAVKLPGIGGVPHLSALSALCFVGYGESQMLEDRSSGTVPPISVVSVSFSHEKYRWPCGILGTTSHSSFWTHNYKLIK